MATLPKVLLMSNLNLKDCKEHIDLSQAVPGKGECQIDLMGTDVSKVNLDYDDFRLLFDGYQVFENGRSFDQERKGLYKDLLMHQKMRGYARGYRKLLMEFELIYPEEAAQIAKMVSDEFGASDTLKTSNPVVEEENQTTDTYLEILEQQREVRGQARTRDRLILLFTVLGVIIAALIGLYVKTSSKKSKPLAQKVQYQSPVTPKQPNYFKQEVVSQYKAKKTVFKGEELWGVYQRPEDVLQEPEVFWEKYEQLLEKAKGKKLVL